MNNLKKLRKERNITQTAIAKYLNISQNTYSYWENGKVNIDSASLAKLAEFYEITIDELIGKEKKETLKYYELLNEIGKQKVQAYVNDLLGNPLYKKRQ